GRAGGIEPLRVPRRRYVHPRYLGAGHRLDYPQHGDGLRHAAGAGKSRTTAGRRGAGRHAVVKSNRSFRQSPSTSGEGRVLLSMTGYGEARWQNDVLSIAVELRALNNRYMKVTVRAPEPYHLLEPEIEKVLRGVLRRGTVQVALQVRRQPQAGDYRLNPVALQAYYDQVRGL